MFCAAKDMFSLPTRPYIDQRRWNGRELAASSFRQLENRRLSFFQKPILRILRTAPHGRLPGELAK